MVAMLVEVCMPGGGRGRVRREREACSSVDTPPLSVNRRCGKSAMSWSTQSWRRGGIERFRMVSRLSSALEEEGGKE